MIAIDSLVSADFRIPESIGFLLAYEDLDVLQKRSLIALEGNDVISLVPSRSVLKLADASSGGMILSDHAARSIV